MEETCSGDAGSCRLCEGPWIKSEAMPMEEDARFPRRESARLALSKLDISRSNARTV